MNERAALHQQFVDQLVQKGAIRTSVIERAFRAIPRHLFLPDIPLEEVYKDQHILTKVDGEVALSSSSQPGLMAAMIEQLAIAPGMKVMEIGAGTGYNAALLAQLVGAQGNVVTIDLDAAIVQEAREHLQAAGVEGVTVLCHDGALGYPPLAPFDRIILTVGAWEIMPAWQDQLVEGGVLVIPLMIIPGQMWSIALIKQGEELRSVSSIPCGFLPLRGAGALHSLWQWSQPEIRVMRNPNATDASPFSPLSVELTLHKPINSYTVKWNRD